MSALNNSLLLGQEGGGGYAISRSLRFNSSDSAKCARTYSSGSSTTTQTFALWIKRAKLGATGCFWSGYDGSAAYGAYFQFDSGDTLTLIPGGASLNQLTTTQVFRDASAWYHIVLNIDTNNATSSDRIRLYVNGSRVTTFSTASYPTSGYACQFAMGNANNTIGTTWGSSAYSFFDGYLADIHFIDGQALTPTSFGEFSATTGVWMPKAYAGTYGTNGFKLDFSNNASAAALGTDSSGAGNTWSVNNLSVTAGAGNDSLVDVPVNGAQTDTGVGGEVRGNYCTLNPLDKASAVALANGNLEATITTADHMGRATIAIPSSDKWYFEFSPTVIFGTRSPSVGVASGSLSTTASNGYKDALAWTLSCASGNKQNSGAETSYGSAFSANDIGMCAVDVANGKIWWGRNGTWIASGDPAAGTNAAFTNVSGTVFPAVFGPDGSVNCTCVFNFGARSFAYTAPSGFKALNTANLPAPVITKPSTVMDVKLYTGNGSTQTISGLGFSPDLVWAKNRSSSSGYWHTLVDSVRGAGRNLASNSTNAEDGPNYLISALNSDGFSVNVNPNVGVNENGGSHAAWCWDAGSSTVTNTQGSITSQVRTNNYLSIVTYTGNLSSNGNVTVGHGLGVAPQLVITKARSASSRWAVQMPTALSANNYLELNSTSAQASWGGQTRANPTSTVFDTIYAGGVNESGVTYVAYCFAPVDGYSSAFSYSGNGSSDGPMVHLGFRPRFIIQKRTDSAGSWLLIDTARDPVNVARNEMFTNSSIAEYDNTSLLDVLSNGFKIRASFASMNASGGSFIGFAFAEHPFQYARAR